MDKLLQNVFLSESEMKILCTSVKAILMTEGNVIDVQSPVTVCGDIHGQFHDLIKLFRVGGQIPGMSYVFLGDFIDRGNQSVESLTLLLLLKFMWPNHICLLRGNHETRKISQVYGFYDECMQKYGNINVWKFSTDIFDFLPLTGIIGGSIFCVHGGLSPAVKTVHNIRCMKRHIEIPTRGPSCDLVWSDPSHVNSWVESPRGAGWLFGEDHVRKFLHNNNFDLLARAHQLVDDGVQFMFNMNLVTIWSAPNYCYRCRNLAGILYIDFQGEKIAKLYKESIHK